MGTAPIPDSRRGPDIQRLAEHLILSRFAPAGVIIDDELKILHFRGATSEYLDPAPGCASPHVLKIARANLGLELRSLIKKARQSSLAVRKEIAFKKRTITVEVAPIREEKSSDYKFLILFEELGTAFPETAALAAAHEGRGKDNSESFELMNELAATKAQLESTIEEGKATTEELKSANEEIMSSNEELQSMNEELETAKEELQAANEELTTVNDEVQARNSELSWLNNDLTNFLTSVNVPVVMLGTDLKIRRFTPTARQVFNLIPTDIGRPFGDIRAKFAVPRFEQLVAKVIESVTVHEQEVVDEGGRYYQMSIRPYRTPENKIDGAILIFSDINSVKQASLQLEDAKFHAEAVVEAVFDPLLVLDSDFVIRRANSAYYRLFETDAGQTENRPLFSLDKGQWDLPGMRKLLKAVFEGSRKTPPVEITERFSRIGERTLVINARPLMHQSKKPPMIVLTMADISIRRRAEDENAKLVLDLEKERALFESVLRQIRMGVAIFEAPSGNLLLSNKEFDALFKRKWPAAAGIASFRKIRATQVANGIHQRPEWPMRRSLENGEIVPSEEFMLQGSKGERAAIQVSSIPVYDAGRKMIAVVALFQDVSERKRIQQQIIDVSGREQRRIAHDLHDGLGQELAAIIYRIKAAKSHLARAQRPEMRELETIGQLAETVLARMRDLVKVVQPVALDARGLMHGLRELARSASRLYDVDCSFTCPRPIAVKDQDMALHVFRIAQEAVHNAVKHGKPRRIAIGLVKRGHLVELSIMNDGADFEPAKSRRDKGLGLHIMTYRANVLHGDLSVTRHRPRGTLVRCVFNADRIL